MSEHEPTAGEVRKLSEKIEREAASLLGQSLFSFSRLDVNLGLMVASIMRNTGREEQVPGVDAMNFHKRLHFVEKYMGAAEGLAAGARQAMTSWLQEANDIRAQRNQLVHGRWDVDPYKLKVLNIVGLPSSDSQRTIEYTLDELESFVQRTQTLHSRLWKLRKQWQLP